MLPLNCNWSGFNKVFVYKEIRFDFETPQSDKDLMDRLQAYKPKITKSDW